MCVWVCACVYERERERNRQSDRQTEGTGQRETETHSDRKELECVLSVELLSIKQSNLEGMDGSHTDEGFCFLS